MKCSFMLFLALRAPLYILNASPSDVVPSWDSVVKGSPKAYLHLICDICLPKAFPPFYFYTAIRQATITLIRAKEIIA